MLESIGSLGPLPLMIGVSGHRDVREQDYPVLRSRLIQIFSELRSKYPSTPLILLSPLAEGADRLTARAALEQGVRLIAVLPMRRTLYEKDFATSESLKEFDDLIRSAEKIIEVPLVGDNTEASIQVYDEPRNRQYAAAGAFVARHSQVFIALWDGVDTKLTGGTSQIVQFNLEGVPEPYARVQNLLDPLECGPVFQIVTPRVKNPNPDRAFEILRLYPAGYQGKQESGYDRIWKREDSFNRDLLRFRVRFQREIEECKNNVLPLNEASTLSSSLQLMREAFGISDALAIHFQKMAHRASRVFFFLVFSAVFFYQIYQDLVPNAPWDTEMYLASLILIFVLYLYSKQADFENKHLDYRALAEGLRVQLFWRIAGVKSSAADHYLHKQRSDLDWIRDAVRAFSLLSQEDSDSDMKPGKQGSRHGLNLVLDHWVKDQAGYYLKSAWRDRRRLIRLKYGSQGLLLAGAALAFLKVIVNPVFRYFAAAMTLAPAIGAILNGYAEHRGFSQHSKQYGRMSGLFSTAQERLQGLIDARKDASAVELIRELGKEALAENGDWVILHRERPIEILKATS